MKRRDIRKMIRKKPELSKAISIGYKDGCYSLVKPLLKKQFYVILDDYGKRLYEKAFDKETDACLHLLEVVNVNKT